MADRHLRGRRLPRRPHVERLGTFLLLDGQPIDESVGTMLMRVIYHYWFHTGEAAAVRQLLGHQDLPEFVGDMDLATYRPEATPGGPRGSGAVEPGAP